MEWSPLILTFKLAGITTAILLIISIPIAYWLTFNRIRIKPLINALVSMPLVLPPTVLGFYLLIAFSPSGVVGGWLDQWLGLRLVFSFEGLVVASIIYSLPFMVHPVQSGFASLPVTFKEAAYVMGKSRTTTLFKVLLPNIKSSILTGIVLSFAHTIGEFGVVLMIGGSIPGRTKVASVAIYDAVEGLEYGTANAYSLVLFSITFMILLTLYTIKGREAKNIVK